MPYQGGCSQFLLSSRGFDSSICDWKNKFSLFGKYQLFRIESFRVDFRCVHRLQLLKVCDQYNGGENDYLNNSKIILICNRTNRKLLGRKSCSGLVTGNFEKFEIIRGSGNFEEKHTIVLLLLSSSLLSDLLLSFIFCPVSSSSSCLFFHL